MGPSAWSINMITITKCRPKMTINGLLYRDLEFFQFYSQAPATAKIVMFGMENLLFRLLTSLNLLQLLITPIFRNFPPKYVKMSTLVIQKLDVLKIVLSLSDCFVWLLQCDAWIVKASHGIEARQSIAHWSS